MCECVHSAMHAYVTKPIQKVNKGAQWKFFSVFVEVTGGCYPHTFMHTEVPTMALFICASDVITMLFTDEDATKKLPKQCTGRIQLSTKEHVKIFIFSSTNDLSWSTQNVNILGAVYTNENVFGFC